MQEIRVWSLGWEDPLEKGMATHSSILAWRIPWTLQYMGSQRVGHNWATFTGKRKIAGTENRLWFSEVGYERDSCLQRAQGGFFAMQYHYTAPEWLKWNSTEWSVHEGMEQLELSYTVHWSVGWCYQVEKLKMNRHTLKSSISNPRFADSPANRFTKRHIRLFTTALFMVTKT